MKTANHITEMKMNALFMEGGKISAGEADPGQLLLDGDKIYLKLIDDPRTSHKGSRYLLVFETGADGLLAGSGKGTKVRFGPQKELAIIVINNRQAEWPTEFLKKIGK